MASTKHESRGKSVGSFLSIPRTPPSSGFRTKWHTLSSSARGFLCLHPPPPDHAYKNHWPSNNDAALYTPARSKSTKSQPSPRGTTAPWNVVRSRSYHVHAKKAAKHEGREAIWDDKMMVTTTTTTKFSSPERKPSSEATATSVYAPPVEESDARPPRLASRLYDDHVAAPLQFNGTQTRSEGGEHHIATGDTIEALIDALLQIDDSEEGWDSMTSLGMSSLGTEEADLEKAIDDKSMVWGVEEDMEKKTKKNCSAGAREEADARQVWEDTKRRVMHIEEFGALPSDDAERASREFRARRRRNWAKEAIRGHAREEASPRVAAKKRRRHAGCWVREDGVFMRLYARRM